MPSIHNPLYEMLFEHNNGLRGFLVESCQPTLEIKRRYKKRPAMATVWVSTRSSFGMPVTHQTDPAMWVHELTENTLAAIIKDVTDKCGLKYNLTRYHKVNGDCHVTKPTIAHFLTSLTEISGIYNEYGLTWLNPDEYYERFLVNGSSKPQEGCKQIIKFKTTRIFRHSGNAQVYNSLSKDAKRLIRLRVIRLHLEGMKPGGYGTVRSNPSGISLAILDAFRVRIWGKTCQRIIEKYIESGTINTLICKLCSIVGEHI